MLNTCEQMKFFYSQYEMTFLEVFQHKTLINSEKLGYNRN
ncbi:hypothetical protein bcere0010_6620 [Bacillus cereus ATCC 4342]|nr:hypothetical protein bcere0010_6620 [Bacillus cereus ATCC 4342]